jgi:hypothetical protein
VICANCGLPIEPVDGGVGTKFGYRHTTSERIVCYQVYDPEIATPTGHVR